MPNKEAVRKGCVALALLLIVSSLATYVIALDLGAVLLFTTSDGLAVAGRTLTQLPFEIFASIPVSVPFPASLGVLFVGMWGVFALCLAFAFVDREAFVDTVKDALGGGFELRKANFLFVMPLLASALLVATALLLMFQESRGVPTGGLNYPPQTSPFLILANLAFASIGEEVSYRITLIGIPVGLWLLYLSRRASAGIGPGASVRALLLALLSPERAKARLGVRTVRDAGFLRLSGVEWALIVGSSLVFAVAHVLSGSGWEVGKVTQAFMAGLALAFVYVAYGAHASILLHWYFDYYFDAVSLASAVSAGFASFETFVTVINVVGGACVLIAVGVAITVKVVSGMRRRRERRFERGPWSPPSAMTMETLKTPPGEGYGG